ncbi:MFS transporter [Prodigiosinella aquatilis]|nr:MFS transporter [Prodigiosinella sp. LS101]WJV54360.1 MFS transporter [Prodigiosinella sp. LS101]WJV58721.1 MFS transporter [Pectobacteriaceae bacterium C111]
MNMNATTLQNTIPHHRWLRIIPPILITCIISYMDRVNIAFAMPGGMDQELGITASMAGLAGGIFFIGYLFLQVPGGKIAVHGSGKNFIGWSLVAWAIISILTGLATHAWQLLTLRFALGVAEGGMLPVVLTMISNWFPDKERGRANAIVIMFVPIAGIVTSPLSGWIIATLDWRWLFIIEGLLSIVILTLWMLTVSDRPQEARWITPAEKNWLIRVLEEEQHTITSNNIKNASLGTVLSEPIIWQLIVLNFFYQTGIYGYTLWLPTILKGLTHSGMEKVGMLAILPFVGAMLGMYAISLLSDRSGKRKVFISLPLLGFALCMLLSVVLKQHIWWSYAALVGCGVFLQAAAGVFWTIPARLFNAELAGGARGVINALGNLGGFCGPYAVGLLITYYSKDAGVYCLALSLAVAALLALLLPARCDQPHTTTSSSRTAPEHIGEPHPQGAETR